MKHPQSYFPQNTGGCYSGTEAAEWGNDRHEGFFEKLQRLSKEKEENTMKTLKEMYIDWKKLPVKIDLTGERALKAVERDGYALRYVKEQTEAVCLKAVERDGDALRYVKEQTEAVCLKAVERNGDALQYVKEQTEAVCLKAVERDGYALRYVTEEIFKGKLTIKK